MNSLTKVLLMGMLISFAGSLPLGVLNITAFALSRTAGINAALLFAFGVVLVEIIYLRLTLFSSQWLNSKQPWLLTLQWLSVFIFSAMALNAFITVFSSAKEQVGFVLSHHSNSFMYGLFLSAINPLQISFWMGWNTLLFSKGILQPEKSSYLFYLLGAGLGTLMGVVVFIIGGRLTIRNSFFNPSWVNATFGMMYLTCAILQGLKLSRLKSATI